MAIRLLLPCTMGAFDSYSNMGAVPAYPRAPFLRVTSDPLDRAVFGSGRRESPFSGVCPAASIDGRSRIRVCGVRRRDDAKQND